MKPTGLHFILAVLFLTMACNNEKKTDADENQQFNYEYFSEAFQEVALPYQLTDTSLLNNKDTAAFYNIAFPSFIADSIKTKFFGKNSRIRYIPLVKTGNDKKEKYFIIKAVSGKSKAALLVVFNEQNFGAAFPFLIPDADVQTTQVSAIDKAFSISRTISRKSSEEVVTEGKDVYAYNQDAKGFTLIMTDALDEKNITLLNPIDTFSKKHKFAGDYGKDKKNLVSVRDGKDENEINFFIHFEKGEDNCTGELKGTAFFTSSKTAVYRQGGDACVLELHFTAAAVTLTEKEGCGLHRELKCVFDGTFNKKKPAKTKAPAVSSKKKTR